MACFFSLMVVTVSLIAHCKATDWCHLQSCYEQPHTMCTYPSDQPGKACGKMDSNQLSNAEINELVQVHNDFRAKVASGKEQRGVGGGQPAGNIPPLTWDDSLAEVAQRWANQCTFRHDTCRNTEKLEAGQNIAIRSASDGHHVSLTDLVTMWYNEIDDFNPKDVANYQFEMKTGHYTQIVWGKTTSVGCGVAKYYDGKWYSTYLVCNYSPPGNWMGEPVY